MSTQQRSPGSRSALARQLHTPAGGAAIAQIMPGMAAGLSGIHQTITVSGIKKEKIAKTKQLGMDVCFLLDISGSMAGRESEEMVSQLNWLIFDSGLLDRDNDTVQIFAFNSSSDELLSPKYLKTLDRAQIDALDIAARCSGGTRLWTALNACLNSRAAFMREKDIKDRAKIEAKGHVYDPARHVRKAFVLLVLTDGESSDSADLVTARLRGIAHEIPNFHMTLLGIGINEGTARGMQSVADVCGEAGSFMNVAVGAGQHASEAIAKGFRTHFTHTVTRVRKVIRKLSLGADGLVHLKESERELGSRARPVTREVILSAQIADMSLGDGRAPRPAAIAASAARAASPPPVQKQATSRADGSKLHTKPCTYGARCKHVATNKCTFFHPPSERPCRFGAACRSLAGAGRACEFRHDL